MNKLSLSFVLRLLPVVALALTCAKPALALPQDQTLAQFHRTHWSLREGAPGSILALAQTPDGYIWLGGHSGLVRFDGVRFQPYESIAAPGQALSSLSVTALQALPDGRLAIGYRFGGVSILGTDGQLHHAGREQGLTASSVNQIAMDSQGGLWVGNGTALLREHAGRWERMGPAQGLNVRLVFDTLFDRTGAQWVSTEAGIFYRPAGASSFQHIDSNMQWVHVTLALAPDDRVWGYSYEDDSSVGPLPRPGEDFTALRPQWRELEPNTAIRFDRDGGLWAFTDQGTERIAHPERPAYKGDSEIAASLSGRRESSRQGFEDREGNLWIGSLDGLDRYRRNKLDVMPLWPGAQNVGLAPADQGIWAIQWEHDPFQITAGANAPQDPPATATKHHYLTLIHRDARGRTWFGGWAGLWRLEGAQAVPEALPPGVSTSNGGTNSDRLLALAVEPDGGLWLSVVRRGLYHRSAQGEWEALSDKRGLPKRAPLVVQFDKAGRLWLGYPQNQLLRLDGPGLQHSTSIAGLGVGTVLAMLDRGEQTWVAGDAGLAMVDAAGAVHALRTANARALLGLSGLVMTANGDLWLNGTSGIVHISAAELAAGLREPAHAMQADLFDHRDGLAGTPADLLPIPTATQSADGRLWFALENGIVSLDPQHIPANSMPPPVVIESVQAQGLAYRPVQGLNLPERSRDVQIDYTALSLSVPERVKFRYRLDGVDPGWQDAGTRRTAFYTQLGPGDYVFHVAASNNDGVWNEAGASMRFTIAPAFYQTRWFMALCALAAAAVLWGLHRMRLRQAAARLNNQLEVRLRERERIARELHDTLLQGFQGLMLLFNSATQRIPKDSPARTQMEAALDRADEVLVEGRQRVQDLRAKDLRPLGQALAEAGEVLAESQPGRVRFKEEGAARPLKPEVAEAFQRIGREALANACRHSNAELIETTLAYADDQLSLSVKDNGVGIEPAVLEAGGRPGHWGQTGMRERAGEIGASLTLDSQPGAGTTLRLSLPAVQAYADCNADLAMNSRVS